MPECFRNMWHHSYSTPGEVALNTGGEFFSEVYAKEFALLGIRPIYKPEGFHAFLVEKMHGPARSALLKICEENSQWLIIP